MKLQNILRILVNCIVCAVVGRSIGYLIMGKNQIIDNVILIISGICLLRYIVIILIPRIILYNAIKKAYTAYEGMVEELQNLHDERYKLYYSYDEEKIYEYTQAIEEQGNYILEVGEEFLEDNLVCDEMKEDIRYMMKYTQKLLTQKQPIYEFNDDETSD